MITNQVVQLASGGIQDTVKGSEYQLKLLQLFSLRAYNKGLEFTCWTEDEAAGKYDDVVYKYLDNKTIKYTCLQAKQKVNTKRLELQTFFNDKNYHLYKYFESFVAIESNYSVNYKDIDLEEIIICTNNSLKSPVNGFLKLSDPVMGFSLHLDELKAHDIFDNCGIKFRPSSAHESDHVKFIKNTFLAIELVKLLFEASSTLCLLKFSKNFLLSDIFEISGTSLKFRDEFLEPGHTRIENFRNLFKAAVVSGFVSISGNFKRDISKDFWQFFKNFKLKHDLIKEIFSFIDDDKYIDEKVSNFIRKTLFVTRLEEFHIDQIVRSEIQKHFQEIGDFNLAYLEFNNSIKDWLIDGGRNQNINIRIPINREKVEGVFQEVKVKSNKSHLEVLKKNKFGGNVPVFQNFQQEFKIFLDSAAVDIDDRVLIYEVYQKDTFWGCLKLHQTENSLIYLNIKYGEADFVKAREILRFSAEKICVVIEVNENSNKFLMKLFSDLFKELKANTSAKLVVICDAENSQNFSGSYKKIIEGEIICEQLSDDSLKKYLERQINFQGIQVQLQDLIQADQIKKVPLNDLENMTQLGAHLLEPDIYLPRKLFRKTYLKDTIQNDQSKDFLCFNENDFHLNLQNNLSGAPVHLIEKILSKRDKIDLRIMNPQGSFDKYFNKLLWKRSHHSIKLLRSYIDENEAFELTDVNFLSNSGPVNLLKGIAGMGKSLFFQQIAFELKGKFRDYWIEKIDLQGFYDELQEFEEGNIKNNPEIQNFFYEKFMKFKNKLKLKIFKNLLVKGRVIFLFDGYDEICETYQDTALKIICALIGISIHNKFFISTRPEWSEFLEDKFLYFTYAFEPFSEGDQQDYLMKFWGKDSSWRPITIFVLENLNNSISDKEKFFTGVPLITNLIGEYFVDKLEDDLQKTLKTSKISVFDLLYHFIHKKFMICCTEKLGMNKNNPFAKKILKSLEVDHQILALKLLFPQNVLDILPSLEEFDEETILKLIKCGLVEYYNGKLKFHHQTSSEFLVAIYFKTNFNKPGILRFILKVVLKGNGYQLIRMFMNGFIGDLLDHERKKEVKDLLKENLEVLNVAAKESNFETFEALFEILTDDCKSTDTKTLDASFLENEVEISDGTIPLEKSIQNLLMWKDLEGFNIFFHLFSNCNINLQFIDSLKCKFGLKFIKNLLQVENGENKLKILSGAGLQGKNYYPLLKWIIQNFLEDLEFLKEMIFVQDHKQNSFLYDSTDKFDVTSFLSVLKEIKIFEKHSEENFLSNLLLMKNSIQQIFIHSLVPSLSKIKLETEKIQTLKEILMWIKHNTEVLNEILFSEDNNKRTFIHHVAWTFKLNIKDLLEFHYDLTNSYEFLLQKDKFGIPFLTFVVANDEKSEASLALLEVLEWLKGKNFDLLKELVYSKDKKGGNLVHSICQFSRKGNFLEILKNLLNWLSSNIPNFDCAAFLTETDNFGFPFIVIAVFNDSENEANSTIINILEWLKGFDENLLNEIVQAKYQYGRNLLHSLFWLSQKKNLPSLLKTLLNWLPANLQNFNIQEFLRQKDVFQLSFLHLIVYDDSESEATQAFFEILDWLKETDFDLLKELLFWKDDLNRNLIQIFCENARKKDLPDLLKLTLKWMTLNIQDFEADAFLREKDIFGQSFFHVIVLRDEKAEATSTLIEILDWLKESNSNLLQEIIDWRDIFDKNFFQNISENARKKDLPNILKKVSNWLTTNIPNFNLVEFLGHKDKFGYLFLNFIVWCDHESEATSVLENILDWLRDIDFDLAEIVGFKDIFGRNLVGNFCEHSRKKVIPEFLKILLNWLSSNFQNFNRNKFLLEQDNYGYSFLHHMLFNDKENEASRAMIEVLDWLKQMDYQLFIEIISLKDNKGRNLYHIFCKNVKKPDLTKALKLLLDWLNVNIIDFDRKKFLIEKDESGVSCLDMFEAGSSGIDVEIATAIREIIKS